MTRRADADLLGAIFDQPAAHFDVIGQRHDQMSGDGERADRTHAQGITVRRRFRGEIEAERERAARTIVNHDLLMQLVGQCRRKHPRERIGRAADPACGTIMRIGWSGYSAAACVVNAQVMRSGSN